MRGENKIDSLLSREFAFLLQNWVLLGMMVFVLIAFPELATWLPDNIRQRPG